MTGEATEIRDAIFAEKTYRAAYEPERCIRTHRWKYIRRFDDYPWPVLANTDDSASKDLLLAHGWVERAIATEQLYDLVFDPNEAHNLADEPAVASVLVGLRGRLETWMHETQEPLLDGPVPAPGGAELNWRDQLSPRDPTTIM